MIRHIVLFNLKPELEDADRDWLFTQIRGLAKIPSVKAMAFGKLLDPKEEWYKSRMWADFGWALTMEFDDEAGLYAYQADPYHVFVGKEIRKRITIIKASDFVSI